MGKQVEETSKAPWSRPWLTTCCELTLILVLGTIGLSTGYLFVDLGLFHPNSAFFQGLYLGMVLQVSDVTRRSQNIKHLPLFLALVVWLAISEQLGLIPATPDSNIWTYLGEPIISFAANKVSSMMQNWNVFIVLMGVAVIFYMPFRKIPRISDNPATRLTDEEPSTTTTANTWKGTAIWALKPFFAVFVIGYFIAGFLVNPAFLQGHITGQCMIFLVHHTTGQAPKFFVVSEALVAWLAISELIGLIPLIPDMRAYLQEADFAALFPAISQISLSSMMQNGNGKSLIFLIGVAVIIFLAFRKSPTPTISGNPSTKRTEEGIQAIRKGLTPTISGNASSTSARRTEEGIQEKSETLDEVVVIKSV